MSRPEQSAQPLTDIKGVTGKESYDKRLLENRIRLLRGKSMSVLTLKDQKNSLLIKREELQQRLISIQNDFANGLDRDWEEQAIQLENAEVLNEIARVTAVELTKTELAIEAIERELIKTR